MTTAAEWQGRVGRVWAEEHARTERAFADIARCLDAAIADVAPATGRALDIGCGIGSTSLALSDARPGLAVIGADLSGELVMVASERARDRSVTFVTGDAVSTAAAHAPLDLLVSRHGVMFFPDPLAAFAGLAATAAPDAPLVFSCFRARRDNEWADAIDRTLGVSPPSATGYAPGPFAFADPDATAAILSAAGWRSVEVEAHDVRYVVGTGEDPVADALAFFRRIGPAAATLAAATPAERARLEDRLAVMLRERTSGDVTAFTAAIWIWRARAMGETA